MRVIDLQPGDRVTDESETEYATFLVQSKHPIYPGLQLVVWWLSTDARWSFDALSPIQFVGHLDNKDGKAFTHAERQANLRAILHGTEAVPV
jgi:hypothetical protein